jgi:broad specificity phosphatase PhoE
MKIVKNLRERNNYGILTGMIRADAKKKFPDEVKKLTKGVHHHIENSEDFQLFKNRILLTFKELMKSHKTIAIITHGGPIRCIIKELLNKEITAGDCAIIVMKKNGGLKIISSENAVVA